MDMEDRGFTPQIAPSLGELIRLIRNTLERVPGPKILWFRGHRSTTWELVLRIWRDYDRAADERNFTNRFRSRATSRQHVLPEYDNSAIWLSIMQHYGQPYRTIVVLWKNVLSTRCSRPEAICEIPFVGGPIIVTPDA